MGDFSRDTFRLTNAMHQLLTGEPVADARHYVSVRLQQGVPLLDADVNELDDVRNAEVRAILRYFIGDGVPASPHGFEISEGGGPANIAIGPGVLLVAGFMVINLELTTYTTQPESAGLPALTTPGGGTDRTDVVYLDVWHDQVRGTGGPIMDARLVNAQIGVETAVRVGRRWQVRVREGFADLVGLPVPPGHTYLPLARLLRQAGAAVVRDFMIQDLRRPGLTMAQNLKAPIRLQRGLDLLTPDRFGQMLSALRTTLFARLRGDQLPYQTAGPQAQRRETILLMGLQDLMHLAQLGEVQALGRSMDNADALRFMGDLYTAQAGWVDLLEEIGNEGGIAQALIDGYRDRLEGNAIALIRGLRPALDRNDLLEAVQAQEIINLWLSAPVETLPEGSVDAVYQAVIPFENLQAGTSYAFSYRIAANFTSPRPAEAFNVQVTLPVAFGTAAVDQPVLSFAPTLAEATVIVTVVPSGITPNATLEITAVSARNATLRSTQPGIQLTLGATPPVAAFFFYAGPALNAQGRLEIPQNHLTRPQGRDILFRLQNTSAADTRTYRVTRQIVPAVADTTGWAPLAATAIPDITRLPGAQTDVLLHVDGPKPPAPAPPVGTTGAIVASAVLIAVNGAPPVGVQTPIVVNIPFIVV